MKRSIFFAVGLLAAPVLSGAQEGTDDSSDAKLGAERDRLIARVDDYNRRSNAHNAKIPGLKSARDSRQGRRRLGGGD